MVIPNAVLSPNTPLNLVSTGQLRRHGAVFDGITDRNEGGKSPLQALGESVGLPPEQCTPYINHLRAYGATAFVHIHDLKLRPKGRKMMAKAVEGKLCGYEGNAGKVYRV